MKIVNILDFESHKVGDDWTPAVTAALESISKDEEATLFFPKAEYTFYPDKAKICEVHPTHNGQGPRSVIFDLEHRKNFTLDANGSDFLFIGQAYPFWCYECENLTLKGFSEDFDRMFLTQATVIESNQEYFDVEIDKEKYPYKIEDNALYFYSDYWCEGGPDMVHFLTEFDPKTGSVAYDSAYFFLSANADPSQIDRQLLLKKIEPLTDNSFRLYVNNPKPPRKENVVVFLHAHRSPVGAYIEKCTDVTVEDMYLYHCGGMGIVCDNCKNIKLNRVNVIPKPNSGRLISINADATHFTHCEGYIRITDCVFEGMIDDAINIHGFYTVIDSIADEHTVYATYYPSAHDCICDGDKLAVIDRDTMQTVAYVTVKHVHSENTPEFFMGVQPKASIHNGPKVKLVFEEPISEAVREEMVFQNLTKDPTEVYVGNIKTGKNRPRGILISTAAHTVIENCEFYNSEAAIDFTCDAKYWFESTAAADVTIRNNRFVDCAHASFCGVIRSCPLIPKGNTVFHKGIKIYDNVFESFSPLMLEMNHAEFDFHDNTYIKKTDVYKEIERPHIIATYCDMKCNGVK